jgi:hypothetical protein
MRSVKPATTKRYFREYADELLFYLNFFISNEEEKIKYQKMIMTYIKKKHKILINLFYRQKYRKRIIAAAIYHHIKIGAMPFFSRRELAFAFKLQKSDFLQVYKIMEKKLSFKIEEKTKMELDLFAAAIKKIKKARKLDLSIEVEEKLKELFNNFILQCSAFPFLVGARACFFLKYVFPFLSISELEMLTSRNYTLLRKTKESQTVFNILKQKEFENIQFEAHNFKKRQRVRLIAL